MPQSPTAFRMHSDSRPGRPIVIAQGEPEGKQVAGGEPVRAGTEGKAEEQHQPGEMPSPQLLFWNTLIVFVVLIVFALVARSRRADVPKGLQNFAEQVVESLNALTVGILGHGGEKYTPLVGTVFLYILLMNLIGIIPGLHSPTANITTTLALGVTVFVYAQYQGIRQRGLRSYFRHFMGPSITGKFPELFFLIGPIDIISELIKPFTLAIRLFGNIFGEDVILLVLAGLGLKLLHIPGLPLQFLVLFLAVLTDVVQALVFAMLTCIYILLLTHHEEGEQGEERNAEGAHAHAASH
jgi:F-type H+-transporting ATPase subunit a